MRRELLDPSMCKVIEKELAIADLYAGRLARLDNPSLHVVHGIPRAVGPLDLAGDYHHSSLGNISLCCLPVGERPLADQLSLKKTNRSSPPANSVLPVVSFCQILSFL